MFFDISWRILYYDCIENKVNTDPIPPDEIFACYTRFCNTLCISELGNYGLQAVAKIYGSLPHCPILALYGSFCRSVYDVKRAKTNSFFVTGKIACRTILISWTGDGGR